MSKPKPFLFRSRRHRIVGVLFLVTKNSMSTTMPIVGNGIGIVTEPKHFCVPPIPLTDLALLLSIDAGTLNSLQYVRY